MTREDRPVAITAKVDVTVTATAFNLGRAFAEMGSMEQAEFFAGIHDVTKGWDKCAGFQWVMVRQHLDDMPDALAAFKVMAEYAEDFA
jgi:hypothetical protein